MRKVVNKIVSLYLSTQYSALQKHISHARETQMRLFNDLLRKGIKTKYGKDNGFSQIKSYEDFSRKTPLNTYESITPYI